MKLYLVRHGETALNEKGCYYGKTDAVLSVRGIEQAKISTAYILKRFLLIMW